MQTHERIIKTIEAVKPQLLDISQQMYQHPELGFQEKLAFQLHTAFLERQGFVVEKGICGMETGYRAIFHSDKPGPTVALLAEYDALPQLGHACGHNLVGACALAAGAALKAALSDIGGTVQVVGAPAEETSGAKVQYVEAGVFDGVDAALLCHPGSRWSRSGSYLAITAVQFEFFGKAAHAAASPELGINALDAALATMNAVNALREHIRSDSRIHGIIKDGGKAPNIVPDYTNVQYYVRSPRKRDLTGLVDKVINCAKAGALATGCELKVSYFENGYDDLMTNETLSDVYTSILAETFGIEAEAPHAGVGSTDLGNVSHVCPAIHPTFDITGDPSIAGHTPEMAAATQTAYAKKNLAVAATAMALTAVRVLTDSALLQAIRAEFAAAAE